MPNKVFSFLLILLAAVFLKAAPLSAASPQKGQLAPPFNLVTTSGQQVSLANYKGYVLVIDFFATWCVPCQRSVPHLQGLNSQFGKKKFQILGISVDEDDDKSLKQFSVDKKLSYPVALANAEVKDNFALSSIPTVYVINKRGVIAEVFRGYNDTIAASVDNLVTKLLAE